MVIAVTCGEGSQNIGVKLFVAGQVSAFDAQQIFNGAGDIVAFHHFGRRRHGALERLLRFFAVVPKPNTDIGHKPRAHRLPVQHRAVAGDHPRFFQLLNPTQTGRRRQTHALCQL